MAGLRIAVFGAGSIGCYVGGRLAASGSAVRFIGRPRLAALVAQHGLTLTDYRGAALSLPAGAVDYHCDAGAAADADLVLVCVKSAATAEAAAALAPVLKPGAVVLSLQNGVGNAEVLRGPLSAQTVLAGMVPFNVLNRGEGAFHQGTEGDLEAAADPALAPALPHFEAAGLPLQLHSDMHSVLWSKLLLNLNNPLNALCGLPLKQELEQRAFRRCLALLQGEGLALLRAAGIQPVKLTPLPPHWLPRLLDSPDFLFRRLAARMLAIDPLARSSMWEDLEAGRATEIDWINGELLKLAARLGLAAPANARVVELIRAAESGGRRDFSGDELLAELRRAAAGESAGIHV